MFLRAPFYQTKQTAKKIKKTKKNTTKGLPFAGYSGCSEFVGMELLLFVFASAF
jgi:hypothetical protein